MSDGDARNPGGTGGGQASWRILDRHGFAGAQSQPAQGQEIGLGIRLDGSNVLLADDQLESSQQVRGGQDGLDVLTPGGEGKRNVTDIDRS